MAKDKFTGKRRERIEAAVARRIESGRVMLGRLHTVGPYQFADGSTCYAVLGADGDVQMDTPGEAAELFCDREGVLYSACLLARNSEVAQ